MPIPPTSRDTMVQAIQQFNAGVRSPQGPKPGTDWLGNGAHHHVLVGDDGEPYPVKEIIRLAVKLRTGAWPPRFWGGPAQANKYAEKLGFIVAHKDVWLREAGRG